MQDAGLEEERRAQASRVLDERKREHFAASLVAADRAVEALLEPLRARLDALVDVEQVFVEVG